MQNFAVQPLRQLGFLHHSGMIERAVLILLAVWTLTGTGCFSNQKQTPDQIRQKTAEATSELKQDSKAVAEGIRDGLRHDKLIDLNHVSKSQLMTLPGMSSDLADGIIAERPYKDPAQLVSRRILSSQQYDQIKDRVTVSP